MDVCVTATLVDALVLARSGFHHDICSRSVRASCYLQLYLGLANQLHRTCCMVSGKALIRSPPQHLRALPAAGSCENCQEHHTAA